MIPIAEKLFCITILATILRYGGIFGTSQEISDIYRGDFSDIPVDAWEASEAYSNSLVSQPVLDFKNDTALRFTWTLKITDFVAIVATHMEVEVSNDFYSDDFQYFDMLEIKLAENFSNNTYYGIYTAANLQPETNYRFRLCPVFGSGRGSCSLPFIGVTLAPSSVYWEPILPRRLSLTASGRGFTNPVVQRPHLSTGVEVFDEGTSDNPLRFSDAVTSEAQMLPSGRRGHSLSLVDDNVFLFGGRTNGYSCATIYADTLNLGNTESGRVVYPCTNVVSEVNELWSLDINNYQWSFLNTSKWKSNESDAQPPGREQHSAAVINKDIFIFGGKTRVFDTDSDGNVLLTHHADVIYGDLWKLSVERAQQYILHYPVDQLPSVRNIDINYVVHRNGSIKSGTEIPQDGRLLLRISAESNNTVFAQSDGVTPREGKCIDKAIVRVTLYHPCIRQIKVSILGPGPISGSPNYFAPAHDQEVILFSKLFTNRTGCAGGIHHFEFDDDSTVLPEECCTHSFNGTYRPQGRLSEFIGNTMTADWTLVVQDLDQDTIIGTVLSWEIVFSASPCVKTFQWTNLTTVDENSVHSPGKRYGARTVAYRDHLFIYGGQDVYDRHLSSLYRYDVTDGVSSNNLSSTGSWTRLEPLGFENAWNPSSSIGANFALTSFGLLRFGGYYRQPAMANAYNNYDSSVSVQDPVTLRWREVVAQPWPIPDSTFGHVAPSERYLAASVFIPSHRLRWRTQFTHRNLYDQPIPSSRGNHQGSISDSLFVFGGFDSATGSVYDGSSGGYFSDLWMLRLSNWSTPGVRDTQQQYLELHCAWRSTASAILGGGGAELLSCLGVTGSPCELRDLIMLPWCDGNNQTVV